MRLFLAVIFILLAWNCIADDSFNDATNEPLFFKSYVVYEYPPNLPPQQRLYVTFGAHKFTMVAPKGYRVRTEEDQRRVTFTNPENYSQLTFHIVGPGKTFTADSYRDMLSNRYAGLRIDEELFLNANGQAGPAFDFKWRPSGGELKSMRMGFVPSAVGCLEFGIIASPENFSDAQNALHQLLLTFRASDKNGKLEIAPPSDKL